MLVGVGRLQWRQGRHDLAERNFAEALRRHPGYELARRNLEALRRDPQAGPPPSLASNDAMAAADRRAAP